MLLASTPTLTQSPMRSGRRLGGQHLTTGTSFSGAILAKLGSILVLDVLPVSVNGPI